MFDLGLRHKEMSWELKGFNDVFKNKYKHRLS